jgi:hypothetical protein
MLQLTNRSSCASLDVKLPGQNNSNTLNKRLKLPTNIYPQHRIDEQISVLNKNNFKAKKPLNGGFLIDTAIDFTSQK